MIYCVNYFGILLSVYVEDDIILKTSFSQNCEGMKRNDFQRGFEKFILGDRKALNFTFGNTNGVLRKIYLKTMEIPFGFVSSYGDISRVTFGNKKYSRLVGYAMSVNPLPIIVPCHRVVRSDGSIGGFSSPIEIKLKLLEIEKVKIINGKVGKAFFANI
jgi:methylated-DNA-[protein]-cysteine S-methyltransferase